MEFSLFYFSSDQGDGPGAAYRLLTEGARFADEARVCRRVDSGTAFSRIRRVVIQTLGKPARPWR